jgi:hypothetical protein
MCADAVSHFGGTTGYGRNLGGAMGGVGRSGGTVGQPPATAARCAGGGASGHGRLDRCTLLTAPCSGAPRGPALPGTEKEQRREGGGGRPADGRSRTVPGTSGGVPTPRGPSPTSLRLPIPLRKVSREDAGPEEASPSRVATPSRIPPPISRLLAVPEPVVAGERFRKKDRPGLPGLSATLPPLGEV